MPDYYRIKDKGMIARQDDMFSCAVFVPGRGWVHDSDNLLLDRMVGFDGNGIGNTDIMSQIEKISEKEAYESTAEMV